MNVSVASPQNHSVPPAPQPMSDIHKWCIVGLLGLGILVANLHRLNLSVVLTLEEFRKALHVTDVDRGLLNSAFFWVYAFLQVPVGWVVDRLGVKRPYAISFALWCAVSAATGMANAIWQIVLLRVLLGIGEAIVLPASLRFIRLHFEEKRRALPIAVYMLGIKTGPAVGAPLAVALIAAFGWRLMFVILGLAPMIVLVFWQRLVPDDDREIERASALATASVAVSFAQVVASPAMWGTLIGTFCYDYFWYFCLTWLPSYFVEQQHLSMASMGTYMLLCVTGQGVVMTTASWLSDRLVGLGLDPVKVRRWFVIAGLMLASTEIFGALSRTRVIALFFAAFSLAGLGFATATRWSLTQSLFPGAASGQLAGIQNTAANLAGIVAPLITGWLKHATGSYAAPMQWISILLLVGALSYALLVRRNHIPLAGSA
jgi:ACS family D-galactonate transporter-like MFS transporter